MDIKKILRKIAAWFIILCFVALLSVMLWLSGAWKVVTLVSGMVLFIFLIIWAIGVLVDR
jgi:hypothetical protein